MSVLPGSADLASILLSVSSTPAEKRKALRELVVQVKAARQDRAAEVREKFLALCARRIAEGK